MQRPMWLASVQPSVPVRRASNGNRLFNFLRPCCGWGWKLTSSPSMQSSVPWKRRPYGVWRWTFWRFQLGAGAFWRQGFMTWWHDDGCLGPWAFWMGRTRNYWNLGGFPHPKLHLSYQLVLRWWWQQRCYQMRWLSMQPSVPVKRLRSGRRCDEWRQWAVDPPMDGLLTSVESATAIKMASSNFRSGESWGELMADDSLQVPYKLGWKFFAYLTASGQLQVWWWQCLWRPRRQSGNWLWWLGICCIKWITSWDGSSLRTWLHQVNCKLGDDSASGAFVSDLAIDCDGWGYAASRALQAWMEVLCVLDCIRSIASLVMTVPLAPSSPIWQLIVMAWDMLHQVNYKLGWKFFAYLTASGQLQVWWWQCLWRPRRQSGNWLWLLGICCIKWITSWDGSSLRTWLHQVNCKLGDDSASGALVANLAIDCDGWRYAASSELQAGMEVLCVLDCIRSIASLVMKVPLAPSSPIWQLIVMAGDMLHQGPYKLGWKFFAYLTASGQLQVWWWQCLWRPRRQSGNWLWWLGICCIKGLTSWDGSSLRTWLHQVNCKLGDDSASGAFVSDLAIDCDGWGYAASSELQAWMEVLCVLDCIRSIASLVMTVTLAPSSPIWQLIVMAGDLLHQVNYKLGWKFFVYLTASGQLQAWWWQCLWRLRLRSGNWLWWLGICCIKWITSWDGSSLRTWLHQVNCKFGDDSASGALVANLAIDCDGWGYAASSELQAGMEVLCVLDCIRSIASLVMTVPLAPSSPIWQLIVIAGDMLHQVPYKLGWKFFAYLTASGQLQVWWWQCLWRPRRQSGNWLWWLGICCIKGLTSWDGSSLRTWLHQVNCEFGDEGASGPLVANLAIDCDGAGFTLSSELQWWVWVLRRLQVSWDLGDGRASSSFGTNLAIDCDGWGYAASRALQAWMEVLCVLDCIRSTASLVMKVPLAPSSPIWQLIVMAQDCIKWTTMMGVSSSQASGQLGPWWWACL